MQIFHPTKIKKVTWITYNEKLFPKINDKNVPGYKRLNITGCQLYWDCRDNFYKDIKESDDNVKWVKSEYPFYYSSISEFVGKRKDKQKQIMGFGDFIIVYKGYFIMIEIDETKPHSKTDSSYYKTNAEWLNHQLKDYGKTLEIVNNGGISMHIPETNTYQETLNAIKKEFKVIDSYIKKELIC